MKPSQGINKHLEQTIILESIDDAEDLFVIAKDRLLDVNNWHKTTQNILQPVQLTITNKNGERLHRSAHKNDYIQVAIPGQEEFRFFVESIRYDDYPDESIEQFRLGLVSVHTSTVDRAEQHEGSEMHIIVIERIHAKLHAHYYHLLPDNLQVQASPLLVWDTLLAGLIEID